MLPPKSKVWTYFEQTLEGMTCILCSKSVIIGKGGKTIFSVFFGRQMVSYTCTMSVGKGK